MVWKIKIFFRCLLSKIFGKMTRIINDRLFNEILFFITFLKKPDFDNPKTFNEFICSFKYREEELEKWEYTDKYQVRKYIESVLGGEYLNEIIGIYKDFDSIDFHVLPPRFVLRATHGSSYNIVVKDKNNFNIAKARRYFRKWLSENYYHVGREKNYYLIKPRIICDRFINDEMSELEEIKLFCFNGKVGFIQFNQFNDNKRFSNLFDKNWRPLKVRYGYPSSPNPRKPHNAQAIIKVAEELAKPFKFVRVDLYNPGNKIIFSELTFHPGGGLIPFYPKEYDYKFGKLFNEDKH
jgi:hypothetical protein